MSETSQDHNSQTTEPTIYAVQAGGENIHVMIRGRRSERVQYDETGRIIKIGDEIIRHAMVEEN